MKAEYETDFKWLNLCDMDPDFVKGSGDLLLLLRLYRVFHSMSSVQSIPQYEQFLLIHWRKGSYVYISPWGDLV